LYALKLLGTHNEATCFLPGTQTKLAAKPGKLAARMPILARSRQPQPLAPQPLAPLASEDVICVMVPGALLLLAGRRLIKGAALYT